MSYRHFIARLMGTGPLRYKINVTSFDQNTSEFLLQSHSFIHDRYILAKILGYSHAMLHYI